MLVVPKGMESIWLGGWQVIKSGREFKFLPPEQMVMRQARGPGYRWAA